MPHLNMTLIKSILSTAILFIVVLFQSCNERPKDLIAINYKNDSTLSLLDGHVKDSMLTYFPDSLYENEDDPDNFFKIRNSMSYALFKMKEPLLYNYFFGKETYRIFWVRSFRPAIAMRIKFDHGIASITIKKLNRTIGYPFIAFINHPFNFKSESANTDENMDRIADSLIKVFNNCNYYNTIDSVLILTYAESDSLVNLISDCDFWETNPSFKLKMKIDGDDWIIEGQNQYGYQIKLFTDLFNPNYTDRIQQKYEALCNYLLKKSGIKEKP
jgi:hypothetical protein